MSIQTKSELEGMRRAGEAVALTLRYMCEHAKPGMSAFELDTFGGSILKRFNAHSAPLITYGFPGNTCISINHEVAHGIPGKNKVLKEGDLVNIDVSAEVDGFYADNGASFVLGKDVLGHEKLVNTSKHCLHTALKNIRGGVRISDIGGLIETMAKRSGFTVIRNLVGHGIGRSLHEEPKEIPCYYDRSNNKRFKKNSVVAVETFISTRGQYAYEKGDGWTYVTKDKGFVAQHEHTIIVTDSDPIILTSANGI